MQNQYRFPAQRLHGAIWAFRQRLPEIESMPEDDALADEEQRIAKKLKSGPKKSMENKLLRDLQNMQKTRKDNDTKREQLFSAVHVFISKLRTKINIPVSSVLSTSVREKFETFVNLLKHLKDLYLKVIAKLKEPTLEQVDA